MKKMEFWDQCEKSDTIGFIEEHVASLEGFLGDYPEHPRRQLFSGLIRRFIAFGNQRLAEYEKIPVAEPAPAPEQKIVGKPDPFSRLFTVKDAAKKMGVSADSIYGWISQNQFPHLRFGRRILIDSEEVSKYLRQKKLGV